MTLLRQGIVVCQHLNQINLRHAPETIDYIISKNTVLLIYFFLIFDALQKKSYFEFIYFVPVILFIPIFPVFSLA